MFPGLLMCMSLLDTNQHLLFRMPMFRYLDTIEVAHLTTQLSEYEYK